MPAADAPPVAPDQQQPARVLTFEAGDHHNVDLLGGKGAGLVRMTAAGLPVPPGFIITTEVCRERQREGRLPSDLLDEIARYMRVLEGRTGRGFGHGPAPLLVSVRSGAPVSMPGMMETILNLGLNAQTAEALARETGDPLFSATVFVRFMRMYGEIVLGATGEAVDRAAAPLLATLRDRPDAVSMRALSDACQAALREDCGDEVPADAFEQVAGAIGAVFDSWNSRRAITYRNFHGIAHDLGTAVVVQAMVFGNLGTPSGTGVAFSRDPLSGEPTLFGEFLEGGQGEDVVAGTLTPQKIAQAAARFPELFAEFEGVARRLEELYRDVVDIEFTVERGKLFILQVRSAKRTAQAALRIAADFLTEMRLSEADALRSVTLAQVRQVGRPGFEPAAVARAKSEGRLLGSGIGASPGQVSGRVALDPDRAEAAAKGSNGAGSIILVRPTTSPHDLHGMIAARGILTSLGGATSHAAVVARALNKACVVGCDRLTIDAEKRRFRLDQTWFDEGDEISIDGATGELFAGALPVVPGGASTPQIEALLAVADRLARCRIFARVATTAQIATALACGATGVAIRLGDVLTTSGKLGEFIDAALAQREGSSAVVQMAQTLADLLAPLLAASGHADFALRAVDLATGEATELLRTVDLFAREPRLALPLGVPELIEVQVRAMALAIERAGYGGSAQFIVRHINDPSEMRELRRIASAASGSGRAAIAAGATMTSVHGALLASEIGRHADVLWLEARSLIANAHGYPSTLMLTADPLDDYLRRGLLSADPRTTLDESMTRLFLSVAGAAVSNPECRIGIRLSGQLSEQMVATLFRSGFRSFIVDPDEVRVARVALGREAAAMNPANG
jgi:pyruvate,orthophosphate dikinase